MTAKWPIIIPTCIAFFDTDRAISVTCHVVGFIIWRKHPITCDSCKPQECLPGLFPLFLLCATLFPFPLLWDLPNDRAFTWLDEPDWSVALTCIFTAFCKRATSCKSIRMAFAFARNLRRRLGSLHLPIAWSLVASSFTFAATDNQNDPPISPTLSPFA